MTKQEISQQSDVLLTAHIFANQIALQRLFDFKEFIIKNNKALYQGLREPINQAIRVQQALHDLYKSKSIGMDKSAEFYKMMDDLNKSFDETLLKP